ncbi:MAG: hypothetical protein GY699_14950, partial [Desulfobacteraceae bacterium]|nr:hypothetical protein [Desulfobacteraceae bacterium]
FEGSGLTSDEYIEITTEWTDADGTPLPQTLEGYTGRLAKVVAQNTLGNTGYLANFEIKPGRHLQLVQLPEGTVSKAHYYIHISGEKIIDNPDFSSLGGDEAGKLFAYRPKHFVPFMVPLYDKEQTDIEQEIDPTKDPVYQWVFRPEMQFSLFELEKMEYQEKDEKTGETYKINMLDPDAESSVPLVSEFDFFYDIVSDQLPSLLRFGSDRELIFAFGDQEIKATLNEDGSLFYKVDSSTLDFSEYLTLRLFQNGDDANILWEYAIPQIALVTDYDRNGQINDADKNKVTKTQPWRFWVNNDEDDDSDTDTGLADSSTDDLPGRNKDNSGFFGVDKKVNGVRDLVDFFPVMLDFIKSPQYLTDEFEIRLKNKDEAVSIVKDVFLNPDSSNEYLTNFQAGYELRERTTKPLNSKGYLLTQTNIKDIKDGKSVILVECIKPIFSLNDLRSGNQIEELNTTLELEVYSKEGQKVVARTQLPMSINDVTRMYRLANMRNTGGGDKTRPDRTASKPPFCMDTDGDPDTNPEKELVFIHGYNVDEDGGEATFAEVFKRLYHSGYKGGFYGVCWYGNPPASLGSSHYHQAVVSAFNFSETFANFVNGLPAKKSVAAHSLGNMVTGLAIQDHGLKVNDYFAIDAAVALEAYGLAQPITANNHMIFDDWERYIEYNGTSLKKLFASEWHNLFDATDNRSRLTWKDRLKTVVTTNIYNFHSSTENVLANYEGSTFLEGITANSWAKQEKFKGRPQLLPNAGGGYSPYAGWGFNFGINSGLGWSKLLIDTGTMKTYRQYTAEEAKNEIIDVNNGEILKTEPFFTANPEELFDPATGSAFVMRRVGDTDLNDYYHDLDAPNVSVRNWLLAEAFPATSWAMGSNPHEKMTNFNMSDIFISDSGHWPEDRKDGGAKLWWHSDYKDLSYQHSYKFFKEIVGLSK